MLWGWKGRETYVERGWMDRGRCGGNYEARSVAGSAGVCQRILSWGLGEWDGMGKRVGKCASCVEFMFWRVLINNYLSRI